MLATMSRHDQPAASGITPGHFPPSPVDVGHVAPSPRRLRGLVGGAWLFDTTAALYVWEHPYYPQYYVPADDVRADLLTATGESDTTELGTLVHQTIRVGEVERPDGASQLRDPGNVTLRDTYRFDWAALDRCFEEDEEVFVHPRSPYVRVDAIRSARPVRVEIDGQVVAQAPGCVVLFETGLPPRHYLAKTAIDWTMLRPTDTETSCPYKGTTSAWWDLETPRGRVLDDVAWSYDFPTRQVQPVAGLVCFDDTLVDVVSGRAT